MADIFISYSRADQARVHEVSNALQAEGFTVWWDVGLKSGDTFDAVIERELAAAKCVVVAWSANSTVRKWVRNEAREGDERGVLAPIMLDKSRPPIEFRGIQTEDLSDWRGDTNNPKWRSFIEGVHRIVGSTSAPRPIHRPPAPAVQKANWLVPAAIAVAVLVVGVGGFLNRGVIAGLFGTGAGQETQVAETANDAGDSAGEALPQAAVGEERSDPPVDVNAGASGPAASAASDVAEPKGQKGESEQGGARPGPSGVDARDEAFWQKVEARDSVSEYQAYLDTFPAGQYAALAKTRIAGLQSAAQTQQDEQAWRTAATANSLEAYRQYLNAFAQGRHAAEASDAMAAIQSAQQRKAAENAARVSDETRKRNAILSLAGNWRGQYGYDSGNPAPVAMRMQLNSDGSGLISGRITEPNSFGNATTANLYANVSGSVSGNEIRFTKTYDGTGGQTHSVQYVANLSSDRKSMLGRWSLQGANGTFSLVQD